jgi:DNA-binding CsgD family transcriptional regulator
MTRDSHPESDAAQLIATLGEGEIECLRLVGEGLGSKAIARRLGLSPHTVDARLKATCRKLGTNSRFVAAKMLADNPPLSDENTPASPDTKLVYENVSLPSAPVAADKGASAGEGDGPGDLDHTMPRKTGSITDSGSGGAWLEPDHPIAKFFGGENRFSVWQRLLVTLAIAMGSVIAFGVLVNGLVGISRLISSP